MNRRDLVKLGLLTPLAGCASVDKYVDDSLVVEPKIEVPGSTHLVHVKQTHWTPHMHPKFYRHVVKNQDRIYGFLAALQPERIYLENVITGNEAEFLRFVERADRSMHDRALVGAVGRLWRKDKVDVIGTEEPNFPYKAEAFSESMMDVANFVVIYGERVLDAYNDPSHSMHESVRPVLDRAADLYPAMFDLREERLLSLVADQPQAVTVYGTGHDFSDAVEQRNRTHESKISLSEVTPGVAMPREEFDRKLIRIIEQVRQLRV